MKRYFILSLTLALAATALRAQDEKEPAQWMDVSELYYVSHGCTDEASALRQYILVTDGTKQEQEDLFVEFQTFQKEFHQIFINTHADAETAILQKGLEDGRDNVNSILKTLRENQALAAQSGIDLAQLEAEIARISGAKTEAATAYDPYKTAQTNYSVDPSSLWNRLVAVAVNRTAYTGWRSVGNDVFLVTEAPRYQPLNAHSFDTVSVPESSTFQWRMMTLGGRYLTPAQYEEENHYAWPEDNLLFIQRRESDGNIRGGALNYDGIKRIPFIYENYWSTDEDGNILMLRLDEKLDVYTPSCRLTGTREMPEDGN